MVSPAVNVVRYTALASGIVYGIVHRKTLQERFDKTAAEKEVQQRAHWLEEAKKAWEAQKMQGKSGGESTKRLSAAFIAGGPASTNANMTSEPDLRFHRSSLSAVVTDPEAPNFDLEALLKSYEK
ncbi:ATPase, F0 complex, subunit E, mitochondrial [Rhodotorula toruloides]|uniref:ATP synthase F(0) complex subunit e, mitochondrial n=1 Tax=Rhodotorula toruloides TaxID=5286 RepID=A0A511K8S9_RHOTO|nr:ATPase, F0 complex, subunit E, mitochondrial [Rhodotorula toruloides]